MIENFFENSYYTYGYRGLPRDGIEYLPLSLWVTISLYFGIYKHHLLLMEIIPKICNILALFSTSRSKFDFHREISPFQIDSLVQNCQNNGEHSPTCMVPLFGSYLLSHMYSPTKYALPFVGTCTVQTPSNKQQFHKNQ